MVIYDNIEAFNDHLNDLSGNYKVLYCSLKQLNDQFVDYSIVEKSKRYLKNEDNRMERIKTLYNCFSSQFSQLCEKYLTEVNSIEEEDRNEVTCLKNDFEDILNELKMKNEELNNVSLEQEKEFSFIYKNQKKSKMDEELVMKYPGSYMYREYMYGDRTSSHDVYIDCDGENDELIVKYMKNDKSLEEDIRNMSSEKKVKLLGDMAFLELPIKKGIIIKICHNEDNDIMEAWRNRKILVNDSWSNDFNELLKKNNYFDANLLNGSLKSIHFDKQNNKFFVNMQLKYYDVIEDYLKNGQKNKELVGYYENGNVEELVNEMKMIGIKLNEEEKNKIKGYFYHPMFTKLSKIIDNSSYDKMIQKWTNDRKWKLIYRASEHRYRASYFHETCDNKGPTLIIIKSNDNCIFGGYTTQSWYEKQIRIIL